MQVINILNRHEQEQARLGHTIQCVGTNPLIVFEVAHKTSTVLRPSRRSSIEPARRVSASPQRGSFPCLYCDKVCSTKQALGGHTAAHRRNGDKRLLTHKKEDEQHAKA